MLTASKLHKMNVNCKQTTATAICLRLAFILWLGDYMFSLLAAMLCYHQVYAAFAFENIGPYLGGPDRDYRAQTKNSTTWISQKRDQLRDRVLDDRKWRETLINIQ